MRIEKRMRPLILARADNVQVDGKSATLITTEEPFLTSQYVEINDGHFSYYKPFEPDLIKLRCRIDMEEAPPMNATFSRNGELFESIPLTMPRRKIIKEMRVVFTGHGSFFHDPLWFTFMGKKLNGNMSIDIEDLCLHVKKFHLFPDALHSGMRKTKEGHFYDATQAIDVMPIFEAGCGVRDNAGIDEFHQYFVTVRGKDKKTTLQVYNVQTLFDRGLAIHGKPFIQESKELGKCLLIRAPHSEGQYTKLDDDIIHGAIKIELEYKKSFGVTKHIYQSYAIEQQGTTEFVEILFWKERK